MKLSLPYFKQDKSYTCGPAALQAVLKFFGDTHSEEWLEEHLETSEEEGTSHESLIKLASELGYHHHAHSDSTWWELKYFLALGLPVIVNFLEPVDDIGHYAVVVGLKKGEIILNDPAHGPNFKLKKRDFQRRWQNSTGLSRRWFLVLAREPLKCPSFFLSFFTKVKNLT